MSVDPYVIQDHAKDEEEEEAYWNAAPGRELGADSEFVHGELTGECLPADLVQSAREEECRFMEEWGVWQAVPVSECWRCTGKRPLGTSWVDVNKGDLQSPDVRCRLVAQEVNTYKEDALFAATPPFEALRRVLSQVATGQAGSGGRKVMILDAKKAHLHAYAERGMFVELPPERRRPGVCGRLVRSLYGTRDAPSLWEKISCRAIRSIGFHPRPGEPVRVQARVAGPRRRHPR